MKKLKPCPFCGGEANMLSCDIRTKHYATSKGAFNAWNRRANDGK